MLCRVELLSVFLVCVALRFVGCNEARGVLDLTGAFRFPRMRDFPGDFLTGDDGWGRRLTAFDDFATTVPFWLLLEATTLRWAVARFGICFED